MSPVLAFLAVVLILERLLPRSPQISSTNGIKAASLWFIANIILLPLVISNLSLFVGQIFFFKGIGHLSGFIQFLSGLIALDFFKYFLHYLFHKIPFLWRFHQVHHSIEDLNAVSSFRISWAEGLFNILGGVIVCAAMGLKFEVVFIINMISMLTCLVQHANFKLPKSYLFEILFVTPDNHKYHHAKKPYYLHGQNFGFVFNCWDRLFGTYVEPVAPEEVEIGLEQNLVPADFIGQFFHPVKIKDGSQL